MTRRPSFQFYPQDFTGNAKLRRCSWAARGAWIWTLSLLHDSDEYGVLRWPLEEIAQAIGCPIQVLRELSTKGVLKGSDGKHEGYTYRAMHARKLGPPVVLLSKSDGPCWYSSRMLKDEHRRQTKGDATRFPSYPQESPDPAMGEPEGESLRGLTGSPTGAERQPEGDGSASASASASINIGGNGYIPVGQNRSNPLGDKSPKVNGKGKPSAGWHRTPEGIDNAGRLLGMTAKRGEDYDQFKARIFEALGDRRP